MARAFGREFLAVVLAPFHLTLYAEWELREAERIEAILRDAEGLRAAKRVAFAFNDPKRLDDERTDLMDRAGMLPARAEAMAKGRAVIDAMKRIDAAAEGTDGG